MSVLSRYVTFCYDMLVGQMAHFGINRTSLSYGGRGDISYMGGYGVYVRYVPLCPEGGYALVCPIYTLYRTMGDISSIYYPCHSDISDMSVLSLYMGNYKTTIRAYRRTDMSDMSQRSRLSQNARLYGDMSYKKCPKCRICPIFPPVLPRVA